MLTKEQILAVQDRASEDVEVPEWGGSVRVTMMSGTQRDRFEQSLLRGNQTDTTNAHAKLVAACVVDEVGGPLFAPSDIEALGQKSAAALGRIVDVARRLNRIGVDELEAAKGN